MMKAQPFKLGDIVMLKIGGPLMTVAGINGEEIWCRWFAGLQLKAGFFPAYTLVKKTKGDEDFKTTF